ncbi:hypothetical protein Hdeb2414_s0011g00359401 [Helianthus debilis subsp. tardiflorus]
MGTCFSGLGNQLIVTGGPQVYYGGLIKLIFWIPDENHLNGIYLLESIRVFCL